MGQTRRARNGGASVVDFQSAARAEASRSAALDTIRLRVMAHKRGAEPQACPLLQPMKGHRMKLHEYPQEIESAALALHETGEQLQTVREQLGRIEIQTKA